MLVEASDANNIILEPIVYAPLSAWLFLFLPSSILVHTFLGTGSTKRKRNKKPQKVICNVQMRMN